MPTPKSLVARTLASKSVATAAAVVALTVAPLALSHLEKDEPMQSFRQSYFTLVAMNFGPMAAMAKGEMPWDDAKMLSLAEDLAAIASVDVSRAFGPGTDKGTTRAKPEIWSNTDDFLAKYADLQSAADKLLTAAQSGDKAAIGDAIKDTGGACKACHDEYKAKDYLY